MPVQYTNWNSMLPHASCSHQILSTFILQIFQLEMDRLSNAIIDIHSEVRLKALSQKRMIVFITDGSI